LAPYSRDDIAIMRELWWHGTICDSSPCARTIVAGNNSPAESYVFAVGRNHTIQNR
jgi:hypothetical protein